MMINPHPPLGGYTEVRNDIVHLSDEFNKKRLELIEIQRQINEGILQLVLAADKLFAPSLKERDADGNLKKEFKADTNVQAVAEHMLPSRRNCGLCGKPGHRRDNCPDADKVITEKREEKELLDERREAKAAIAGTGKRACSNCHKPGHRAKNCPEPVIQKRRKRK